MERIQIALKKAREERARSAGASNENRSETPSDAPKPTAKLEVSERKEIWESIKIVPANEKLLDRNRIVAFRSGPQSLPYDVMRTKLLYQMRKNSWTRVAIMSPTSGAGKSMTALNLAFSLARQDEVHIMLIELDMRRPSLARILGANEGCQFSKALVGEEDPMKHLLRLRKNLIVASNATPARNPAEILQSTEAAKLVDDLQAKFKPDVVIFDTAPLFAGDDTMAFLDQVDCAVLIAEAEKSTADEIDKCERELTSRTNLLGVTLNKCRYLSGHEEYGKEYGY